jgi:hypothetical protein
VTFPSSKTISLCHKENITCVVHILVELICRNPNITLLPTGAPINPSTCSILVSGTITVSNSLYTAAIKAFITLKCQHRKINIVYREEDRLERGYKVVELRLEEK